MDDVFAYTAPAVAEARALARRAAALWYEFQDLRYTLGHLWQRLEAQRRLCHLEPRSLHLTAYPVRSFVGGALGVRRLVRRPAVAGGAGLDNAPRDLFVCSHGSRDGAAILSLSGDLDLAAAPSFLGHLTRASQVSRHVILDLSGLGYMDSTGINALLKAHELFAMAGQRIALAAVPATIRRILNIVAIEEVIPLFPTVDAAINGLRQPPTAH